VPTLADPPPPALIRTSGVGSMPGVVAEEATRVVVGEFDVPHLVELPARGPGADLVGRALGLVVATSGEFAAETTPSGWRLAGARAGGEPGRSMRRAAAWLGEDTDRLEEQLAGYVGPAKAQLAGPWTIAAALESARGTRVLADAGACRDLAVALGEAVAAQMVQLRRRVPGAAWVLQLDEPSLATVLAGHVRTASGRGALRVPEPAEVRAVLGTVVDAARAAGAAGVSAHCCAGEVPFEVLRGAGIDTVSLDLGAVGERADEALGAWWDVGGTVHLGVAPALDPPPEPRGRAEGMARRVEQVWQRIGFGAADVAARTWLTPTCGLAGASPAWARSVGGELRAAARMLESAE
jgi:methionine synthase II (cobalamin-independent)